MLSDKQLEQLISFILDALYNDGVCTDAVEIRNYIKWINLRPVPPLNRIADILTKIMRDY